MAGSTSVLTVFRFASFGEPVHPHDKGVETKSIRDSDKSTRALGSDMIWGFPNQPAVCSSPTFYNVYSTVFHTISLHQFSSHFLFTAMYQLPPSCFFSSFFGLVDWWCGLVVTPPFCGVDWWQPPLLVVWIGGNPPFWWFGLVVTPPFCGVDWWQPPLLVVWIGGNPPFWWFGLVVTPLFGGLDWWIGLVVWWCG